MMQTSETLTTTYLSAIEADLQNAINQSRTPESKHLYDMLEYHMGWTDKIGRAALKGKRIRPLLSLLSCSSAGGDWKKALPAAAAVEMVHNFSLIHDDIEDHSSMRRGRKTVWKKWGVAQAINAGDAMFTLAHLQMIRLRETMPSTAALNAVDILQQACLQLTQGQQLDLAYEKCDQVSSEDYWLMVEGKTAALISASVEIGAICASVEGQICTNYRNFGRYFGLAFQAMDDYLGIWGNSVVTGKSNQSDLYSGKKTLPVIYGLSRGDKFSELWFHKPIKLEDVPILTELLDREGGKEYTINAASNLINHAIDELQQAKPSGRESSLLAELALNLLNRQS